eukprot:82546-Rhodomonas_salina.3
MASSSLGAPVAQSRHASLHVEPGKRSWKGGCSSPSRCGLLSSCAFEVGVGVSIIEMEMGLDVVSSIISIVSMIIMAK